MNAPTYSYVTYIATTPEKLWEALTQPEFSRQYWFGRSVEADWRLGGAVRYVRPDGGLDFDGEVLRYEPYTALSYSFRPTPDRPDAEREPASRVLFEILPIGSQVRLRVTHDQFPPDSPLLAGVSQGWPVILSGLKSVLERGAGLDGNLIWDTLTRCNFD